MARARNIKPGFFTDGQLTKLSIPARFLFAALWCLADREGRLVANIDDIELFAFPRDDVDIGSLMEELSAKFIVRYEAHGEHYIQIKNFQRHQTPHVKEQASTIPPPESPVQAPDMHQTCTGQAPDMHQTNTVLAPPDSLIPGFSDSLIPDIKTLPHSGSARIAPFDQFWQAYPKKKSKGDAEKAWKTLKPDNELLATMLEKLAIATTCQDWVKEGGKYIPYPATWLRAKGWEDEYGVPMPEYREEDTL